jgi:hypothetical protein
MKMRVETACGAPGFLLFTQFCQSLGVHSVELVTWIAAGVVLVAVAVAGWQLMGARRRMRDAARHTERMRELAATGEAHAEQARQQAEDARGQARWAWEQVRLAAGQVQQARGERRAGERTEQWEWAYALTRAARELVEAGQELIRVALDTQVTPRYRLAAEQQYHQAGQRWQDTMIKTLSRTTPTLALQHQVNTFACVAFRLHGRAGVVLRAAETGTLTSGDTPSRQAIEAGQELESVRRQLQRTISTDLATTDTPSEGEPTQHLATQHLATTTPPHAPDNPPRTDQTPQIAANDSLSAAS